MRTWLIVLYLGQSVAVVGPLDVDLRGCFAMADDRELLRNVLPIEYPIEDITLDCVRARRRPGTGEQR